MSNGTGNPFKPRAPTANVAVTAVAQTISPTYAVNSPTLETYTPCTGYLLTNVGTVTVFVIFGASPVVTASNGIPLQAGSAQTFTGPENSVVQCIAAGVGSTLYVTPGEGV